MENCYLEGIVSIQSAIKAGKREITEVYADEKKIKERDRKALHFISILKENNIKFIAEKREVIDKISQENGGGSTHGGFIAKVGSRTYSDFDNFLDRLSLGGYAVFLDGVEDPFNFGYSMRCLYAFGAKGFIVPQRNWMTSSNTVARSSAGASELCDITIAPDDETAVQKIKEHGIGICCSALSKSSVSMYDFKPDKPFILFIGGEKRGISKVFMENADRVIHIPYANEEVRYSLPTASVSAIFGSYLAPLIK